MNQNNKFNLLLQIREAWLLFQLIILPTDSFRAISHWSSLPMKFIPNHLKVRRTWDLVWLSPHRLLERSHIQENMIKVKQKRSHIWRNLSSPYRPGTNLQNNLKRLFKELDHKLAKMPSLVIQSRAIVTSVSKRIVIIVTMPNIKRKQLQLKGYLSFLSRQDQHKFLQLL